MQCLSRPVTRQVRNHGGRAVLFPVFHVSEVEVHTGLDKLHLEM